MVHIVLLGTCDTKLKELLYLRSAILSTVPSIHITLLDVGQNAVDHHAITIHPTDLRQHYAKLSKEVKLERGDFMRMMTSYATTVVQNLNHRDKIHGIVAAGGSGGTSLAAAVMREALSIGVPKLIVSTVASGDTGGYVGEADITLM